MKIEPLSSFISDQPASDFGDLVAYWHANDVVAGDTTWVDRVTGLTINSTEPFAKDADGIYCTTSPTFTVTGTMPIVGINFVFTTIYRAATGSAALGGAVTFGYTADAATYAAPGISTTGALSDGSTTGAVMATSGALTGIFATTNSLSARAVALLAGTNRVVACANNVGGAEPIGTDNDATTGTFSAVATLPVGTESLLLTGIYHANGGQRQKVIAIFNRSTSLGSTAAIGLANLQLAVSEMARTRELYAGWKN